MSDKQLILVVDDDPDLVESIAMKLESKAYRVAKAYDGEEGWDRIKAEKPDLIILDVMMETHTEGFQMALKLHSPDPTSKLASFKDIPILMLTAKSQEIDKVLGLELGADDYVTKPFSPRELLARVKALLRRSCMMQEETEVYCFADIEIDFKKRQAVKKGDSVHMTALEFSLMHFLIKHQDRVLDRTTLLDEVWGRNVFVLPKTVDTHIGHLRKKLEEDPANPEHIIGVRGTGYRFIG